MVFQLCIDHIFEGFINAVKVSKIQQRFYVGQKFSEIIYRCPNDKKKIVYKKLEILKINEKFLIIKSVAPPYSDDGVPWFFNCALTTFSKVLSML